MDFSKALGKKLLWSGEFMSEGYVRQFLLFEDNTCLRLPDPDECTEPVWIDDPKAVLGEILGEHLDRAIMIFELGRILENQVCQDFLAGLTTKEDGCSTKEDGPLQVATVPTEETEVVVFGG